MLIQYSLTQKTHLIDVRTRLNQPHQDLVLIFKVGLINAPKQGVPSVLYSMQQLRSKAQHVYFRNLYHTSMLSS